MSEENFNQQQKIVGSTNRTFGLVFTAVFSLVGLWPLLHDQSPLVWALVVSGAFLVTALAWPSILGLLNRWWLRFGLLLHSVISPIALSVLFYGVVAPTGIIMRLTGHDPLRLKFDSEAESYWIERTPPSSSAPSSMINQF